MDINDLNDYIVSLESEINIDKGKRDLLESNLKKTSDELRKIEEYEDILSKVQILFQETSSYGREQAKRQIEMLVTKCLQTILETDIEFVVEITEKREIPQAQFYVISNYNGYSVKTEPELARGGGIVDIISIALRIAFISINKRPSLEGPLIFDEPGKHVSDDYIFNLGEFLKNSSRYFKRQILMVTHNKHLSEICDKSYTIYNRNGVSYAELNEDFK